MIYQTFKTNRVPRGMWNAVRTWQDLNPEHGYEFFDDDAMSEFVAGFSCAGFSFESSALIAAFHRIKPGAGKADLFRYLLMYERGGVYVDIDAVCLAPLSTFVAPEDHVVTGIGMRGDFHQFGLIYSKGHPFMKCAIENSVSNIQRRRFVPGFENLLEGISGPPCLDESIKKLLGIPMHARFNPGVFSIEIDGRKYQTKVLPGDLFGGRVGFKYEGYLDELRSMGVRYWLEEDLFNN